MGANAAASWRVEDQPGDFVLLVGDHRLVEESPQRQVGQRHARRHALLGAVGGDAREPSPERRGVAFASRSFRSAKRYDSLADRVLNF